MNEAPCPICGESMKVVAVQAARLIHYCKKCQLAHHTLRKCDTGHSDPLKAWVHEGEEQ